MAPPTSSPRRPPVEPSADPLVRMGDYTVTALVRRDAFGEVLLAEGPDGSVRLRRLDEVADHRRLASIQVRASGVDHPAVAGVDERLTAGEGTVGLVGAPDQLTLAERRRRGRLGPVAVVATGATLLEGLAELHAAGVVHGAVDSSLVGIDSGGHPRWRDAGLWAARPLRGGAEPEAAADVRAFAEMARDLGPLPGRLSAAVEAVASGAVETPTAAELLALWRDCAAEAGLRTPPAGVPVRVAALLPPKRAARRPAPRWMRLAAAAAAAVAGVAVLPVARLVPGGGAALLGLEAYLPARAGALLTYGYSQDSGAGSAVTGQFQLRVGSSTSLAGVRTVELVPVKDPTAGAVQPPALPFGLSGATLRVEGGAVTRLATGGTVRDLLAPVAPGTRWSDARPGEAGFVTTETRVILGPSAITEPAGRFESCVVVALASVVTNPTAGRTSQAAGFAWYCEGVGLVRVVVLAPGEQDVVDLNSIG